MEVTVARKHQLSCKVSLYEQEGGDDGCINMRMVQEGHVKPPRNGLIQRSVGNIFMPGRPDYPHHGERTYCQVILVSSPANVVVRQTSQMEEFYCLGRDLDA